MNETYEYQGVAVEYKLRDGRQDRQHLVVVFAGVLPGQHDFYGFDGAALDHVKGAVLWIKDSFEGRNSYYMCAGLDFTIERAVSGLIDSTLKTLGLTAAQCTLLGGSKGGSAALHLGLKYDYRNIVASVPQSRIGTYTREKLPDTFEYMAGPEAEAAEAALNEYIPQLVAAPQSHAKNIYIISSEADPEYKIHVEPLLADFSRYENFNLLLTDSTLVTAHPEVTPYNIPFILGTIYTLCEGLAPKFGLVRNGNGQRDREEGPGYLAGKGIKSKPISGFHWILIKGDTISFRAFAAVIGEEATQAPASLPWLLAVGGGETHAFELEAMADRTLSSRLYTKYFCDYLWAGLKPPSDRGLCLRSLPTGQFDFEASFVTTSGDHRAPVTHKEAKNMVGVAGGHAYNLDASPTRTRISKLPLDGAVATDSYFDFTVLEVDGLKLFIRGAFAVPREEMRAWNEGLFALTLRNTKDTVSYALAASNPSSQPLPSNFAPEAFPWAYFSTAGHRGLDFSSLPDGDYVCFVSFVREGRVYTGNKRFSLTVGQESLALHENTPALSS